MSRRRDFGICRSSCAAEGAALCGADAGRRDGKKTTSRRLALLFCTSAAWIVSTMAGCGYDGNDVEEKNRLVANAAVVTEMVFVVRVTGKGEDVKLEVPLPVSRDNIQIVDEEFRLRGFQMEESFDDGMRIAVLNHENLEGRRRFTYKALLAIDPVEEVIAPVRLGATAPPNLRRYTMPTPRLQSHSPLVRQQLVEHVEPRLEAGESDELRMIYDMVAGRFERKTAGGTSSVLRALRKNHANDQGLDRLLVTFLRAAGIPSRNVTGFHLRTDGGRKLERWTEVFVADRWAPMSVPMGWYGTLPPRYLPMSYGERRLIGREGVERLSFKVLVRDPTPVLAFQGSESNGREGP